MLAITHHIPDAMLAAYVSGVLAQPFALVVSAHISVCSDCRAALIAHQAAGGAALEALKGVAVNDGMKADLLARLDHPFRPEPVQKAAGIYPAPVMAALKGAAPRWKSLGKGLRQDILMAGKSGSVRLLYIPPGQAVPDHGHTGAELTLVLQGSFSDHTGRFGRGDVEVADADMDHLPIAGPGEPCICLAATDAPLRFRGLLPRILQPLFRI